MGRKRKWWWKSKKKGNVVANHLHTKKFLVILAKLKLWSPGDQWLQDTELNIALQETLAQMREDLREFRSPYRVK